MLCILTRGCLCEQNPLPRLPCLPPRCSISLSILPVSDFPFQRKAQCSVVLPRLNSSLYSQSFPIKADSFFVPPSSHLGSSDLPNAMGPFPSCTMGAMFFCLETGQA